MKESATLSEAKRKLLEKFQRGASSDAHSFANRIERRPSGTPAFASLAQEQIWRSTQSAIIPKPAFNESITVYRQGPLDVQVLQQALTEIIRRHEAWRTTFHMKEGLPLQVVHATPLNVFQVVDLRKVHESEREGEALRLARERAHETFDLERGPLVKALLICLGDEAYRLCLTTHETVVDGPSAYQVLPRELVALYETFLEGKPSPLPELPIQFGDFAFWERTWLRGKQLDSQLDYWSKQLQSLPVLSWPADGRRPPLQTFRGAIWPFAMQEELRPLLTAMSRREGVTLFMSLFASFAALLHRYTQEEDIIIGTYAPAGRKYPETQALLGYFRNLVALRVNVSSRMTFRTLLAQTRQVISEALSHDDVPFELVLERLKLKPDASRHPVFQILISLLPPIARLAPGWNVTTMDAESDAAKWDMYLQLSERTTVIIGRAQYNPDIFETDTLARMLAHWQMLIKGMSAHPDQPIGSAPLLTDAERHQVLVDWNKTESDYPKDSSLHTLIEAQVERTPDTVAIVHETRRMSYRLLDARANQLGHYLHKLGAGPGTLLGVCMRRSPELVTALLGVLKSGAAYVPLDETDASSRLSFIVNDSALKVLVTERALRPRFSRCHMPLVCLDADREAILRESPEDKITGTRADDLACVIYTSESAGEARGVKITHRSLVNLLVAMQSTPGFTALDTLLAVSAPSSAVAALEIYLPLISGGRLVLVNRETAADAHRLSQALTRMAPTVMHATPDTWRLLVEAGWRGSSSLKVLCGGELLPAELAAELLKRSSSVWHIYGSVETTVCSALSRITSVTSPVMIGRPIPNTQTYILDSFLQPVPVGTPGELYLGGDGLAQGYLGRLELTAEKFITHPFSKPGSEARLYRTGVLARYLPNGEIECVGKTDHHARVTRVGMEVAKAKLAVGSADTRHAASAHENGTAKSKPAVLACLDRDPLPPVKGLRDALRSVKLLGRQPKVRADGSGL
jgi:amino acid adenylation domain-containing protein